MDPFETVTEKCTFVDSQTLKLQEAPETVPAGEMPRNLSLTVDRGLVQACVPGSRVTVTGVYTILPAAKDGRGRGGGSLPPFVRVLGVEQTADGSRRSVSTFSDAEVQRFKEFAARPTAEVLLRIRDMVAPAIFGSQDIKARPLLTFHDRTNGANAHATCSRWRSPACSSAARASGCRMAFVCGGT